MTKAPPLGEAEPDGSLPAEATRSTARPARARSTLALAVVALAVLGAVGSAVAAQQGTHAGASRRQGNTRLGSLQSTSFQFGNPVTTTANFPGCNLTLSPPTGSTVPTLAEAQHALSVFQQSALGGVYQNIETTAASEGVTLPAPTIEYVDISDTYYGTLVNGKIQPVYADTPEWVVEYLNVPYTGADPVVGSPAAGKPFVVNEDIIGLVDPSTFTN